MLSVTFLAIQLVKNSMKVQVIIEGVTTWASQCSVLNIPNLHETRTFEGGDNLLCVRIGNFNRRCKMINGILKVRHLFLIAPEECLFFIFLDPSIESFFIDFFSFFRVSGI